MPHFVAVRCLDCNRDEEVAARWRAAGIPERLRDRRFEGFNLQEAPGMAGALGAAREWGEGAGPPFLLLAGPVGVGKSHLALAAAREALSRGEQLLYRVVPELLDRLRETQLPGPDVLPLAWVRGPVEGAEALILDDLAAERMTAFGAEQLYQIVARRYDQGARTLVTCNGLPEELPERVGSRLVDWQVSRVVICSGRDYRERRGEG